MIVTMRFEMKDAVRGLQALETRAPHAVARAINRSTTTVRATAAREISADMGLRVGAVREQLVVSPATAANPVATITASGRRIPLIEFGARGPEPSRGRGRGVTYRFPRGRGRIPTAFITTMRSGHRGVFRRAGKRRLPIVELLGPSIPFVFSTAAIRRALESRFHEAMMTNLPHEIEFELNRISRR